MTNLNHVVAEELQQKIRELESEWCVVVRSADDCAGDLEEEKKKSAENVAEMQRGTKEDRDKMAEEMKQLTGKLGECMQLLEQKIKIGEMRNQRQKEEELQQKIRELESEWCVVVRSADDCAGDLEGEKKTSAENVAEMQRGTKEDRDKMAEEMKQLTGKLGECLQLLEQKIKIGEMRNQRQDDGASDTAELEPVRSQLRELESRMQELESREAQVMRASLSLGVAEPRQEDGNPQKRSAADETRKKKREAEQKTREAEQKTREAEQKTRGVEEKLHQIEEAAISLNEVLPSCDTNTGSSATEIMKHARDSFVQKEETEKDLKSQNEELQCQLLLINGPGPSRLVNSGASCYLNSAMQALASVPSVGKELRSLTKDPISGDGPRLHMLIKLINSINNHTSDGNRREIFSLEATTVFNDWCKPGQQDAFELLSYVLNQVYDERRRLKKQTIAEFLAEDLPLRLRMRYQLRCGTQGCKALSFTPPQVSLAIHVPVPAQSFSNRFSKHGLQAVVREAFLTEQRLSVDECCEQCRKPCHVLKSRRLVGRVPEVLCLQLQRAQNSASVQLEESLQLTRRDFFESSEEPQQLVDVMHYRLVAVIVHHGFSTLQGHYTCYRRYGPNRWFLAYESSVTECKLSEVLSCEPYVVLMVRGSERQ